MLRTKARQSLRSIAIRFARRRLRPYLNSVNDNQVVDDIKLERPERWSDELYLGTVILDPRTIFDGL